MQQKKAVENKVKNNQKRGGVTVSQSLANKWKLFWFPIIPFVLEILIVGNMGKEKEADMALLLLLGYIAVLFLAGFERKTRFEVFPVGKLYRLTWFVYGFALVYFSNVFFAIVTGLVFAFMAHKFRVNSNPVLISLLAIWSMNIIEVLLSSYGFFDKLILLFAPQVWMLNTIINPLIALASLVIAAFMQKIPEVTGKNEVTNEMKKDDKEESVVEEEEEEEEEEELIQEIEEDEAEGYQERTAKSFFQNPIKDWKSEIKRKIKF